MPITMNKAQSNLLKSGGLNSLGSKDYETISLDGVAKLLFDLAAEFAQDAKENLNTADRVASGALLDSVIPVPVRVMGKKVIADVKVLDYFKFIDKGVKGTEGGTGEYGFKNNHVSKAMMTDIRKWLIREGLKIKTTKKAITKRETRRKNLSEFNTSTQAAYAVATSIKKKGIAPSKFWTNAEDKLREKIRERLGKAFKIDIIETIRNDFK